MRIGVLQVARLGDWTQTMPLYEALREKYPAAELVPLCDPRVSDAVELLTNVKPTTLPFPSDALSYGVPWELYELIAARIRELPRFDWIVRCNDTPLARLMQRILTKPNGSFYFERQDTIHRSEAMIRTLSLLSPAFRLHITDLWRWRVSHSDLPVPIPWKPPIREISIAVGSGGKERQWGLQRLLRTVQIARQYGRVFLVGTEKEREISEKILPHFRNDENIIDAIGIETLPELAGRMKTAGSVLIGLDSGALHLASRFGAATFGLYEGAAVPYTTCAVGSIAAGYWQEQGVENENWSISLQRFLSDPAQFYPEHTGEFRYNPLHRSRVEIEFDRSNQSANLCRNWMQAFLTRQIPSERIATREPFHSLEKKLLQWEQRRDEPDSKPYPLFPETIEEHLLTSLQWSLVEVERSDRFIERPSIARAV